MAQQPETLLKNKFKEALKKVDKTVAIKIQQMSLRGDPDFVLCVNGWSVYVELKRSNKQKPDRLQRHKLIQHQEAGGYSFVLFPENFEEIVGNLHLISKSSLKLELKTWLS